MRQNLFEKYIPEVSLALSKISDARQEKIRSDLEKILKKGVKIEGEESGKEESK